MDRRKTTKRLRLALAAVLACGAAGCAGAGSRDAAAPPPEDRREVDPFEPVGRKVFAFNLFLDRTLLKPVAYVYKEAVPGQVRTMLRNFLRNLLSPVVLANDAMQGEFGRAGDTALRCLMNSGIGLFGIVDVAAGFGIPPHDEDFGQTLAVWGVGEGPYLVLPLLGPSSPRAAAGRVADLVFDPLTHLAAGSFGYTRTGARIVDSRAQNYDTWEDVERGAIDHYATVRSLYRQWRAQEIRNGRPPPMRALPEMSLMLRDGRDIRYRVPDESTSLRPGRDHAANCPASGALRGAGVLDRERPGRCRDGRGVHPRDGRAGVLFPVGRAHRRGA